MIDFVDEIQIMDNDLTHRDVLWSGGGQIVAAGIAEKWWRQHMHGFDGGAMSTWSRAPGRKPRSDPSGHTWQWRCFLCRYLVGGIARICSDYYSG